MISLLLAISLESFNKKPSTAASLLKVQQLTAFSLEGGLHEKIHQVLGRDSIEKPKKNGGDGSPPNSRGLREVP
jgi:hypothetical protein